MRARAMAAVAALALGACGSQGPQVTGADPPAVPDPAGTRYAADATVLQQQPHGPQLCLGAVLDSLPPQCGGPTIVGWDWAEVPWAESAGDTTWAEVHVVGTYDDAGQWFNLTEKPTRRRPMAAVDDPDRFKPACERPTAVDPAAGRAEAMPDLDSVNDEVTATWVTDAPDAPFVLSVRVRPGQAGTVEKRIRTTYKGYLCVTEAGGPSQAELNRLNDEVARAGDHLGRALAWYPDYRAGVVKVEVVLADGKARQYAKDRWGDRVVLESALKPA